MNGDGDGNGTAGPRLARTARRLRKGLLSMPRHHKRVPLRIRFRRTRGRRLRRLFYAFLALIAMLCAAAVVAYHLTPVPKPHP